MTKTKRKPAVSSTRNRKSDATRPRPSTAAPKGDGWQAALERNLRAVGYSARQAREMVELAAS